MSVKSTVLAAALSLAALPAFANMKAPDAQMHFKSVAMANVTDIMSQYAPDATLVWVGGPLDGTYKGKREIREVWEKFAHHVGKTTEMAKDIHVDGNPKGMTVTARVRFHGKMTIPVRYVLVYRGQKIVSEIWQICAKKKM